MWWSSQNDPEKLLPGKELRESTYRPKARACMKSLMNSQCYAGTPSRRRGTADAVGSEMAPDTP